ncbi:MAG: glycosyltransferase family 4 protein [Hyphomicrobiales bacterium]|nr:glycosyltransferase family 4 protein [Hyphomicrobiales bacterium]
MIKDFLRTWRYRAPAWGWRAAHAAHLVQPPPEPVAFVTENADWAIRRVGEYICDGVNRERPGLMTMTTRPDRLADRVVHFGSQYMWLVWGRHMARSNRYAVSFFHGKPEDGPEVAAHIGRFLESVPRLDRIIASAGIVEARLKSWGVPEEKIVRIPIGVDTGLFVPPSADERLAARAALGFSPEQVVIGSFQKDGVGWGDGMEPKLIKGPDVFLEAIDRLRGQIPVAVLLTGPARGFVKAGLERMGVPYRHTYVKAYEDLTSCYHALDIYFVTSREEGGPMGLMESMASHVPVVSTPVGMAPDLLIDGITGGLVDAVDARAVADSALKLLALPEGGRELRAKALDAVQCCAWPVVARSHLELVYGPLSTR